MKAISASIESVGSTESAGAGGATGTPEVGRRSSSKEENASLAARTAAEAGRVTVKCA